MSVIAENDNILLHYAVTNTSGEVKEEKNLEYNGIFIDNITEVIKELMQRYDNIQSVGISVPGIVQNNQVIDCDADGLIGMSVNDLVDEEHVHIMIEAEPRLKAYGYYKSKKELDSKSFALITAPENLCLGAGMIFNGKIMKGENGMAGEVRFLYSKDSLELKEELVMAIRSIISVLNPAEIVLAGKQLDNQLQESVYAECIETVPEKFMPNIVFVKDSASYLRKGLIECTLESMDDSVRLVMNN